ncbi:IclR family transcriptional regulator [Litoreibacter halocynthiae]|uniref:IclR family transcriptional regulator n=1 Tax=Litoreibacter halocynthiae TaxID=1242689 RepID=A0A4R7LQT4_9RHOB|nr:helix-turn-helix domain-containing protein [Litoreibacter halocynthiae]TDT77152.1 IclR family transcriptional regulator [Litoreibacter halocynthiae]
MAKLNRSVERSMKIVEAISVNGVSSLAFLADRTDLPKATILRICATLVSQRWLSQSRSDGRYRIGPGFPHLGGEPDSIGALIEAGKAEIVELSEHTGHGVDLAASIGDGRVEIVDTTRQFSRHGIFPDCIGYRPSPFRSALGSAFLGALEANDIARFSAELSRHTSGKDREATLSFPQKLRDMRKNGYAAREAGYWGRAVDYGGIPRAIGVAIRADSRVVGAINLVWLAERSSVEAVAGAHLERLSLAAKTIGDNLAAGAEGLTSPT